MAAAAAELLERILAIADQALAPHNAVSVPYHTLIELQGEASIASRRPAAAVEERLIGDEVEVLLKCLLNAELHRLDGNVERATRWRTLAQCFLPFLRTDLACSARAIVPQE